MSFTSSFFDAVLVGDSYDREYAAEDFAQYFASFIANGVFPNPATQLQVIANITANMQVLVSPGKGWINGYYCTNDQNYPLSISPANGSYKRIDAIVLRWSESDRNILPVVKTGTPSSSPTVPSLTRNSQIYELMLATVTVNAGATSITQTMITDKRPDSTVCGWVKGVVDQIDTTNLFAQYDSAFQTWFADIQSQLSGDVATNLQNQINQLNSEKANTTHYHSASQITSGILPLTRGGTGQSSLSGLKSSLGLDKLAYWDYLIRDRSIQVPAGGVSTIALGTTMNTYQGLMVLASVESNVRMGGYIWLGTSSFLKAYKMSYYYRYMNQPKNGSWAIKWVLPNNLFGGFQVFKAFYGSSTDNQSTYLPYIFTEGESGAPAISSCDRITLENTESLGTVKLSVIGVKK